MIPNKYEDVLLKDVVCSIRHYRKFTEDPAFKELIQSDACFIRAEGLMAYLDREYLKRLDGKAVILNEVDGGEIDCVDGNRHVAAILMADPNTTIGQIKAAVRWWKNGHEYQYGGWSRNACSIYIPVETDTTELAKKTHVKTVIDYFKPEHPYTKEIRADIPFTSPLFADEDRGRTFRELLSALTYVHQSEESNDSLLIGAAVSGIGMTMWTIGGLVAGALAAPGFLAIAAGSSIIGGTITMLMGKLDE